MADEHAPTRLQYAADELNFRLGLEKRLTTIEVGQNAISTKIDEKHNALQLQLQPLLDLRADVKEHDRQISRWKGANAILTMMWTVVVGGIFSKWKHLIF